MNRMMLALGLCACIGCLSIGPTKENHEPLDFVNVESFEEFKALLQQKGKTGPVDFGLFTNEYLGYDNDWHYAMKFYRSNEIFRIRREHVDQQELKSLVETVDEHQNATVKGLEDKKIPWPQEARHPNFEKWVEKSRLSREL